MYITPRTKFEIFGDKEIEEQDFHIEYIRENQSPGEVVFIPYEELRMYEEIELTFEGNPEYDSICKNPLICVRGNCDGKCKKRELDLYCYRNVPCTNNRPDWNVWSSKYPDFFDLLFDTIEWVNVCRNVDALVVNFDFTPTDYDPELSFKYTYALVVNKQSITVIRESKKIKELYIEYNTKYPTADRQLEESINYGAKEVFFRF